MRPDTWRWIAVGLCLALFAADTVLKSPEKPNHMVFFELHRGDSPTMIGMMRDDLFRLPGFRATRLQQALAQGQPLTVWQYALRKSDDGSYQALPDKQIQLTSDDASRITFGASIRLPDN